jgi:hypothetical protein
MAKQQLQQKSPPAQRAASAALPFGRRHSMEERARQGESSARTRSEERCIASCAHGAHLRCCCCAAGRDALRMESEAKRSHHAGVRLVRNAPECPDAMSRARRPLSRAAVLMPCCGWVLVGGSALCSIHASSAANRRQCARERSMASARSATMLAATPPPPLQQLLSRPLPLRFSPCSAARAAVSTS